MRACRRPTAEGEGAALCACLGQQHSSVGGHRARPESIFRHRLARFFSKHSDRPRELSSNDHR
jgi:hypothetical protein